MEVDGSEEDLMLSDILLENHVSSSLVRQDLFRSDDMPEFNEFENSLQ
jgi:hypothetical protein